MPVAIDTGPGHELAQLYADAARDLNQHWPGEDGNCIGCGEPYPCAEEWITQRAIIGIEARWRREGHRVGALRLQQEAEDRTAAGAAGPSPEPSRR